MLEHPPEQVLVIPENLASVLAPVPFTPPPSDTAKLEQIILSSHTFREREEAEKNTAYKQVIPYVVISHAGRYLLTQRTSKQQEKRLHNLFSIGQGGHINTLDMESGHPIVTGMLREVAEEFHLPKLDDFTIVGQINDNSNDVGKVHLGIVFLVSVKSETFEVAETGKHIARWASVKDLSAHYAEMENWSKILMDQWLCVGTA